MTINVTTQAAKRMKRGYPLIQQEDLVNTTVQNVWGKVMCKGQVIGYGYLGKQNKGVGWLLAFEAIVVDQAFFETRFRQAKQIRAHYFQDEQTTAFRLVNGEGDQLGAEHLPHHHSDKASIPPGHSCCSLPAAAPSPTPLVWGTLVGLRGLSTANLWLWAQPSL